MHPVCAFCEGIGLDASVKGKVCADCRNARYCCYVCQREHWPWHKEECLPKAEMHRTLLPLWEALQAARPTLSKLPEVREAADKVEEQAEPFMKGLDPAMVLASVRLTASEARHGLEHIAQKRRGASGIVSAVARLEEALLQQPQQRLYGACDACASTVFVPQSKCGQCLSARYCGKECQKADWTRHAAVCFRAGSERALEVD